AHARTQHGRTARRRRRRRAARPRLRAHARPGRPSRGGRLLHAADTHRATGALRPGAARLPRAARGAAAARLGGAAGRRVAFAAFLCNPPFGNAIRAVPEETKAALRGRFVGLRGTADLAYYFLALTERLARPDAVTAVVLPRAFLTAAAARDLRRSLLASRPP